MSSRLRTRFADARASVREASAFVGTASRKLLGVGITSIARGLFEAVVLVLVAQAAIAVSSSSEEITGAIGPISVSLSTPRALAIAAVCAVVMFGLQTANAWQAARMATTALTSTRQVYFDAFIRASWSAQSQERVGHLQEVLNTHATRISNGIGNLALALTAFFNLLALLAIALVVNPFGAIVVITGIVVLGAALRPLTGLARRQSKIHARANGEYSASITEAASLALESRVFNVGGDVQRSVEDLNTAAEVPYRKASFLRGFVGSAYQSVALLVLILGLSLISALHPSNIASIGAVVLLMLRSLSFGQQLQTSLHTVSETGPYIAQLREERDELVASEPVSGTYQVTEIRSLKLDDVGYSYREDRVALRSVDLAIEPGWTVGIVGPSGSGKSTLAQVLLRLRTPTTGSYLVNDVPSDAVENESWFSRTAIVPQHPQLLTGTILDNIRFYRDEMSLDDVTRAAERAHILDDILALDDQFQTPITGLGGSVSGGQAQRLCLARALAGSPDLLLLDEPTSALDSRSESLVQESLEGLKGSTTLLIIAHRLSTLRRCDRILVIEHGEATAFDSPDRLLSSDNYFRQAHSLSLRE